MTNGSRNPQSKRVLSTTGMVLLFGGGALGVSGASWWVVLLVITVVLVAGYVIAAQVQNRADAKTNRR